MRDYKKTISDLRNFNANYEANKLTNDAADAIEELLAAVPKWISVEANQKLPVSGLACTVGYFNGGKYGQLYWFDFVSKDENGVVVPHSTDIEGNCIAVYALPEPPNEVE